MRKNADFIAKLTYQKVVIVIAALAVWNLLMAHFVFLPKMSPIERVEKFNGPFNHPAAYIGALAFVVFSAWFVWQFRDRQDLHAARITLFAMSFGAVAGFLVQLILCLAWHL